LLLASVARQINATLCSYTEASNSQRLELLDREPEFKKLDKIERKSHLAVMSTNLAATKAKHSIALAKNVGRLFAAYPLLPSVLALAPAGVIAKYWLDAVRAVTTTYCETSAMARALNATNGAGYEMRAYLALIMAVTPADATAMTTAVPLRLTEVLSGRLVALRAAEPTWERERNPLQASPLFVTLTQARVTELQALVAAATPAAAAAAVMPTPAASTNGSGAHAAAAAVSEQHQGSQTNNDDDEEQAGDRQ